MAKPPRIKSNFALLDVEQGRKALVKHLTKHGSVPVLIEAVITDPFGSDDGVSIEFNCVVVRLTIQEQTP